MAAWTPLSPAIAFAVAVYPFVATELHDLPLQIGDHLYIIEQGGRDGAWYRGYLLAPPSLLAGLSGDRDQQLEHRVFSGIFPANCVEVREYLGEDLDDEDEDASDHDDSGRDNDTRARRNGDAASRRSSRMAGGAEARKRLSKRRSTRSIARKRKSTILSQEPMPRLPGAPKPQAPVPLLRVGDETGLSAAEPLVDEIASCMREWHDARLHHELLARRYTQLARAHSLIQRLDTSRSQLMHDVLTRKELAELREDTVWDLVAGNKMLNDEVIVRSPSELGRVMTAEDSIIDMTRLQANMSVLDRPPRLGTDRHVLYHLLVDVRTLIYDLDQPATLHVSLCAKQHGHSLRPLCENFSINVPVPLHSDSPPEEQARTVFVNLSATDVGIDAGLSSLYIVFRLLRDEPVRQMVHGQGISHSHKNSLLANVPGLEKQMSVKGRHSVFASGQRRQHAHARAFSDAKRPSTAYSQRSDADGRTPSSNSESHAGSETKTVRRLVAAGALDITKSAQAQTAAEHSISLWSPSTTSEQRFSQDADWHEIIREVQTSSTGTYTRASSVKGLDVFVQSFAASDLEALVRSTPTLLHEVHPTPKIGFSGVPSGHRSDIFVTLEEPRMPRNASLAHSKFGAVPLSQRCQTSLSNLQLTLEVRKANGERIDDCIFTASNHQGHTAWRTVGIERGETWKQTIRLAIPAEDVPGSHIVMSIADSPNFPFALAWVPLWEFDAFVRDGDHQVALYVYDEYSSSIIGGKGAYLALPPWHDKGDAAQQNAATISLRTYLCSTEYSQDPTLLSVLHWRNYHGEQLIELLQRFPLVAEIEVVKLLREVFESLFEILHEYAKSEQHEDAIFYNFVVVLSIARDSRFALGNIVEEYASTRFDWPASGMCLLRAFQRLVANHMDPGASKKLRTTFKVGDQIVKLIVETTLALGSADLEQRTQSGDGLERQAELKQGFQTLFLGVMALLRNPMPALLGTQTLLIQHFHSWLLELSHIMSPAEILDVAIDLLDSCSHAKGKLILYRLILLINYSHLAVFKSEDVKATLVSNTSRWLDPYWGNAASSSEQWRDQTRLCCSVVAAQVEELGAESCQHLSKLLESIDILQKDPPTPAKSFSLLFPRSYPFPSRPTAHDVGIDEAKLEVTALLATAFTHDRAFTFDSTQVDSANVLLHAMRVSRDIISCEAFPASWLSLLISHHRHGMTALERMFKVLLEALPSVYDMDTAGALEFDTETWRCFFQSLFALLGSPALAMESFPEQKRRAVWKIGGDVRELGANLLKRSWETIGWETDPDTRELHGFEKLGGYQVQFVPELVGPIVKLCLSVHTSLRAVATDILRSMIVGAWEIDQDLSIIQSAMIDCLDSICRSQSVTESVLQKTFVPDMLARFHNLQQTSQQSLYDAVVEMFRRVEYLLRMLAGVHREGSLSRDPGKLGDTLQLMQFLKEVQSDGAYVRYIHRLAEMQNEAQYSTEAGLALLLHADQYAWDTATILPELKDPAMPSQTAFERKEALLFDACRNLENGRSWKHALTVYRDLAAQYEGNVFDFSKLARANRAIASIHEKITKGKMARPRYFRVVYRGLGFSPTLRDKQFIFEGYQSDRLAQFEDRMQQLHPTAKFLHGDQQPDLEGQFVQIYAVSPHKDLDHPVYQRTKVSQAVREYTLTANPRQFATTVRQPGHEIPVTEQVVEKIIYTTADEFPTILRRSEIIQTQRVTLLPIEAAVERTTRKTQELLTLERRISTGDDAAVITRLTEDILISVDPGSDSSVSKYRNLLPASETLDNTSGEIDPSLLGREQALDTMQTALRVALLDHTLAIRRCLALYKKPEYLPTRAELVPRFEATFQQEILLLSLDRGAFVEDVTPRQSMEEAVPKTPLDDQAGGGADSGVANSADDQGRRRSLPFLRRSLSRQGRAGSRDSRANSRTRERSSSRLSLFRRGSTGAEGADVPGNTSVIGGLKKRLSFLNSNA